MKIDTFFKVSLFVFLLYSCNGNKEERRDNLTPSSLQSPTKVEVINLKKQIFYREIISNGKIYANRKANLKFRTDGLLMFLNVKNGDKVQNGQLIAQLENSKEFNELQQTVASFKEAELKLFDLVVESGGNYGDTTGIDKQKMATFKVKSGYQAALVRKQFAEIQYSCTFLYAPFGGIVADIEIKPYNMVSSVKSICTVLCENDFEAEFPLLENEALSLEKGYKVEIIPFYADTVKLDATITEINPVVDEKGFIKAKAKLLLQNNTIFDGMNVRLKVKKEYPGCLVVPKSAIVVRSGKYVVFNYENGLAKWNYVQPGMENQFEFTITEGLQEGMQIIHTGNINLAHNAPVEIQKD